MRKIELEVAYPLVWPIRRPGVRLMRMAGEGGSWELHAKGRCFPVVLLPACHARLADLSIIWLGWSRERPAKLFVWRQHQSADDWRHFQVWLNTGIMTDA